MISVSCIKTVGPVNSVSLVSPGPLVSSCVPCFSCVPLVSPVSPAPLARPPASGACFIGEATQTKCHHAAQFNSNLKPFAVILNLQPREKTNENPSVINRSETEGRRNRVTRADQRSSRKDLFKLLGLVLLFI